MAKEPKVKNKPSKATNTNQDESRVMAILKKEYAFENWLLAILAPLLVLYGVYIVMGKFGSVNLAAVLGSSGYGFIDFFFATSVRRILSGSFLILIGFLVLVYLLIPYMRPSFVELRKVSWPSTKTLALNSLRVFGFIIFLSLIFVLYSLALSPLFELLYNL